VAAEQKSLLQPLEPPGDGAAAGENPYKLHEELQAAMQDDAGIARTEESLQRSLAAIHALRARAAHLRVSGGRLLNPGWHTCRDVINMLTLSEAIVRSAIERTESRGSQWRLDHLEQDAELGTVNFIARRDGDAMRIVAEPLEPMPDELVALLQRSRFYDQAKLPRGYLTRTVKPEVTA
jgi:succinate dehydrogenase / fumarate reductase flavoprotein subunit